MDLATAIGAVVGVLGFGATVAGAFVGYGKLNGKVEANNTEINDLKDEIKRVWVVATEAQKSAQAVDGLASAVSHLGQQLTSEIKHVVSTFEIETRHTRAQLADIKDELRGRSSPRSRSQATQ
jgi:hypothetical protein